MTEDSDVTILLDIIIPVIGKYLGRLVVGALLAAFKGCGAINEVNCALQMYEARKAQEAIQ